MIGFKAGMYRLSGAIVIAGIMFIVGCSAAPNTTGTPAPTPTPTPTQSSVNQWTWMGGSNTVNNATGVYGSLGIASASNIPGPRDGAMSWTDASGNFWLFGGNTNTGMNDLWEFNPSTNEWMWVSGSNTSGATGVYGTKGVAAESNVPGGRSDSVSWIDASGNFWLFGGVGSVWNLNDLWKFDPTTKQWTWMSGSSTAAASGVYGVQNVAASSNVPGARADAVSWIDASGNLWLFGGTGYDSAGKVGILNDLWEFTPSTQQWVWVTGSSTVNASAVYGSQGVPAPNNVPGSQSGSSGWNDSSGNLWLFGGESGINQALTGADLNDLWEFNVSTKEWVWVSGSNTSGQAIAGVYGTQGTGAAGNAPGSRSTSASWKDTNGNLWLFGGNGYDSTGATNGLLNDLWKFDVASKQWIWVSGSKTIPAGTLYGPGGQSGAYGTLGVGSSTDVPGGKAALANWIDKSGNLWLFGGASVDSTGVDGEMNDLWRYQP